MNEIEFEKTEKTFFSIYSGEFDTRKGLNRSTNKIPSEIVEKIENSDITSADIKELAKEFPIFVYKTCITIHGDFPVIEKQRIGGYKNIIQNGNGSLEIRYNAIDYVKKQKIAEYIYPEFRWNRNSTSDFFYKSWSYQDKQEAINKITELRKQWNDFKFSGMKAQVQISGMNIWGMYHVMLYIKPLLIEGNLMQIASEITKENVSEITDRVTKLNDEKDECERLKLAERTLNYETRIRAESELIKYRKTKIEAKEGYQYVKVVMLNNSTAAYRFFKVKSKGSFGRLIVDTYISKELALDQSKYIPYLKGKQIKAEDIGEVYFFN